tara:strand:+ start:196 stop:747 length:552 start_codon:yes stop_codon:yes gene_type:complete
MEDYKIKYELLSEENKTLRSIIENLISEKCKLSTELKYIQSGSIEKKDIQYNNISDIDDEKIFSEDCCESIQELLKLLDENNDFNYRSHRQREVENAYYSIINKMGITVFYLEDHSINYSDVIPKNSAWITTPPPGGIVAGYNHNYLSVTGGWDRRKKRSTRKKYDIRGKKVIDVMNILNSFR